MACFGDYEIVSVTQHYTGSVYASETVSAPSGKKVVYGWCTGSINLGASNPVQDGDAWKFEGFITNSSPSDVTFFVTCAYLD